MKDYLLGLLIFCLPVCLPAQSVMDTKVDFVAHDMPLGQALFQLSNISGINITFSNDLINTDKRVEIEARDIRLWVVLRLMLKDEPVEFKALGRSVVLVYKPSIPKKWTISGFAEDSETGERLINASVYDRISQQGTTSNEYGFFSLTLEEGPVDLMVSYIGFATAIRNIDLQSDRSLQIGLRPTLTLEEVVISAQALRPESLDVPVYQAPHELLDLNQLSKMPTLGGEPDLIRMAQLLPGVQTGTDGAGGISVRGGDVSQNLVLVDGVPVYNMYHAAGLYSVLNPAAVQSVTFYEGGYPARYGGRLSSVMDVRLREGNRQHFKTRLDVGLLSSRALVEGPLVKGKGAFLMAGRFSQLDLLLKPYSRHYKQQRNVDGVTGYGFQDWNAKLNFDLSQHDRLYLSYYQGRDRYENEGLASQLLPGRTGGDNNFYYRRSEENLDRLTWGNRVGALRWNHVFNGKLFGNTTLTYSELNTDGTYRDLEQLRLTEDSTQRTESGLLISQSLVYGRMRSDIQDWGLRFDLDYVPAVAHRIRMGTGITRHVFRPGALGVNVDSLTIQIPSERLLDALPPVTSLEFQAFVEDEFKITPQWTAHGGLHLSTFYVEQKLMGRLQPRLRLTFQPTARLSWNASYAAMGQGVHLLTSSGLGLPADLWVPAVQDAPMQRSWQIDAGSQYELMPEWVLSGALYYKKMSNLAAFAEGATYFSDWRRNLAVDGTGKAFGLDMALRLKINQATRGWVAYSLARSTRHFPDVNLGKVFPFRLDRRHNVKIALEQQVTPWLELTANWIYATGFAFSLPLEEYYVELPGHDGTVIHRYILNPGPKNRLRMPAYHRLDVNAVIYLGKKKAVHTLHIGAYNLYNQRNPLYYTLQKRLEWEDARNVTEIRYLRQVQMLPFLPSILYSLTL